MKVAIIGAAGAIGKSVVPTLVARGVSVRLVGRSEQKLREAFGDLAAEHVAADVSHAEGCVKALEGADAAVYTLGLPYSKKSFAAYPDMMRVFIEAARKTGLRQLVLITGVYPYGKPQTAKVAEDHPRVPVSVKGEYRKQQEDIVLEAHDPNGLRTLSLRLPDFYGPEVEASVVQMLFEPAIKGAKPNLLGPIDTPHEFVYTRDVGPVVADLLERPDLFGTAYNFAGPSIMSIREFFRKVYAEAGVANPSCRVVQGFSLRLMGLFVPVLREMVEMEYLLRTPVLLDDAKLRAVLPKVRKTAYIDGIRATLAAYRKRLNG